MSEKKYIRLANAIRAQIESGQLQPGDRLPSTAELKAQYGIGNDTVRWAMSILAGEKKIVTAQGEARWVWPGPRDPFEPAEPPS